MKANPPPKPSAKAKAKMAVESASSVSSAPAGPVAQCPLPKPPAAASLSSASPAAFDKLTQHQKKLESETIGEAAMERMATTGKPEGLGYQPLLSPNQASGRPQGFDAVYKDPDTGAIVVGEAKGGYNSVTDPKDTLGQGYGYKQGTIGWVKEAAKATIRSSTRAANKIEKQLAAGKLTAEAAKDKLARVAHEKAVAKQVLDAAVTGKPPVRVEVFHTPHDAGVPININPGHAIVGQTKPR